MNCALTSLTSSFESAGKIHYEELRAPERQEFLRWLLFQIYFQSTLICFPFHFNPQRGKHLLKIPVVSICNHASQLNKTPSIEASYSRANGIIWVGSPNLQLSLRPDSLDLPKIAFEPSLHSSSEKWLLPGSQGPPMVPRPSCLHPSQQSIWSDAR